ncbi:hypothetical protein GWI33_023377 [Rhynchophorus ferrugineus]|uniref:Chitin-binding type-2 domain-containing protein n=1 Tax=Rhynchophorus ferrugineus TaxID=354439 RepID=A0A834ITH3_RHYFE|nr:hypothetical protein GWI33_023377 [Rhynchophorus ferrugineus]
MAPVYVLVLCLLFGQSMGYILNDVTNLENSAEQKWKSIQKYTEDISSFCKDEDGQQLEGPVQYKDDCSKFVFCGPSGASLMNCVEGLLFNNETLNCDYPRDAHCYEYESKVLTKLVIPADEIQW